MKVTIVEFNVGEGGWQVEGVLDLKVCARVCVGGAGGGHHSRSHGVCVGVGVIILDLRVCIRGGGHHSRSVGVCVGGGGG